VKAIKAITITIAAMTPKMAPLPHSPSRPLRFGIAFSSFELCCVACGSARPRRSLEASARWRTLVLYSQRRHSYASSPGSSSWEQWSKSLASHSRILSMPVRRYWAIWHHHGCLQEGKPPWNNYLTYRPYARARVAGEGWERYIYECDFDTYRKQVVVRQGPTHKTLHQ
jgi:hypothetical protein